MELEKVKEIVLKQLTEFTGRDIERIRTAENLVAAGIIDSLVTVNMILACEEEFGITIYPDEARDLISVELISKHILGRLEQ